MTITQLISKIPMLNTALVCLIVYGIVIPVAEHANVWAGCAIGWLATLLMLIVNWRGTFPIIAPATNYLEMGLVTGSRQDINVLRVVDLYISSTFASSIVWYTLWALDTTAGKDGQLKIPFPADVSGYFAYTTINWSNLSSIGFIGSGYCIPVSALAYVWGYFITFMGIWSFVLMVRWGANSVRWPVSSEMVDQQQTRKDVGKPVYVAYSQQQKPHPQDVAVQIEGPLSAVKARPPDLNGQGKLPPAAYSPSKAGFSPVPKPYVPVAFRPAAASESSVRPPDPAAFSAAFNSVESNSPSPSSSSSSLGDQPPGEGFQRYSYNASSTPSPAPAVLIPYTPPGYTGPKLKPLVLDK